MAKEFKSAASKAKPVYNTIIGSTPEVQEEQEVQVAHDVPKTQGRKGEKLPRINMAFSPQNLEYLRIMAGLRGQSITKYVNALVEQDMAQNLDAYDAAKRLTEKR